jgi:hypothetical protein
MNETKWLRIGFYQVNVEDSEQTPFSQVLQRLSELPADETRKLTWSSVTVRLQALSKSVSYWQGDMLRIRMDESPRKAKLDGSIEDIPFDDDEGLGENTAFLYSPMTNTLVVHEHRGGVPMSRFQRYCKDLGAVQNVEFSPILRPEAIQRIAQMKNISKLEVRLAGINAAQALRDSNRATKPLLETMDVLSAPKANITLAVQKKGHRLKNIVTFINGLMRLDDGRNERVRKIQVFGEEEDGEDLQIVDVFQDRMVELRQVELGESKRLADSQRYTAVLESWRANTRTLEEFYTVDE